MCIYLVNNISIIKIYVSLILQRLTPFVKVIFFSYLVMQEANVSTTLDSIKLIEDFGRAELLLLEGTQFYINNALYSFMSKKTYQVSRVSAEIDITLR